MSKPEQPKPASRRPDPELQCMARIDRLLSELPSPSMIPRVLRWVAAKYFEEAQVSEDEPLQPEPCQCS